MQPWVSEWRFNNDVRDTAIEITRDGVLTTRSHALARKTQDAPWSMPSAGCPSVWEGSTCLLRPTDTSEGPVSAAPDHRHAKLSVDTPDGLRFEADMSPYGVTEYRRNEHGRWEVGTRYKAFGGKGVIALSRDRTLLAKGDTAGSIWIWKRTGAAIVESVARIRTRRPIARLTFDFGGTLLVVGGINGGINVIEWASGHRLGWGILSDTVRGLAFTRSGKFLLGVSKQEARLFDWRHSNATVLRHHTAGSGKRQGPYVYGLAFWGHGRFVVSGGWDGTVRIGDTRSGRLVATRGGFESVRALAVAPKRALVAACGPVSNERSMLRVWHIPTGRLVHQQTAFAGLGLAFALDERALLMAPSETQHALLDATTWTARWTREHTTATMLEEIAFIDASRLVVSEYSPLPSSRNVLLLDASKGTLVSEYAHVAGPVPPGTALTHDGRMAMSGGGEAGIRIFPSQGARSRLLPPSNSLTHVLTFGPDGNLFAGGTDNQIHIWDLHRDAVVHTLSGHESYVFQAVFSPDGRTLATTGGDGTIRLWQTTSAQVRWEQRQRLQAMEERLWPAVEQLVQSQAGVLAARTFLIDNPRPDPDEQQVMLDRLMELAWKTR